LKCEDGIVGEQPADRANYAEGGREETALLRSSLYDSRGFMGISMLKAPDSYKFVIVSAGGDTTVGIRQSGCPRGFHAATH
jgi:hypothetical protein